MKINKWKLIGMACAVGGFIINLVSDKVNEAQTAQEIAKQVEEYMKKNN